MAVYEMNFFSEKLGRMVSAMAILPTDGIAMHIDRIQECYERPMKSMYLLSGFSKDEKAWLYSSPIMRYCYKYNTAAFFPSGENAFYIDDEKRMSYYEQYIGEELVNYTRKTFCAVSDKREDTIIGGISMGGYGALYIGLRHPDIFGKILSLSPGIISYDYPENKEKLTAMGFAGPYLDHIFGNDKRMTEKELNLEELYRNQKEKGEKLPGIFLACGSDDFVYEYSRKWNLFLQNEQADYRYCELPGGHDWEFWEKVTPEGLKWVTGICV